MDQEQQQQTKGIFKSIPTKELVEEILIYLKFFGLHDSKYFTKKDIDKELFEEIITWIEPYYIPCKAKRFLYDLNEGKQITILRHLLRCIGYDILSQEKNICSEKMYIYQIYKKYVPFDLSGSYTIEFN